MKRVFNEHKNRYFYSSLVLVLGSLFVFLLFRYTKSVENKQMESQTQIESKSIAMNLDLIMANYVLKTQNLEDYLDIRRIKYKANQQIAQTIFNNTIFGALTVLKNNSPGNMHPTSDTLDVIRFFRIPDPNKKTIAAGPSNRIRNEASRRAISEMIKTGERQKQFFVSIDGQNLFVIINRSKEDKKYFYVLTSMADDLFEEALPKQSSFTLTIEQNLDKTFWLVEKNESKLNMQKVTSFQQSQFINNLGADFVKLDYEAQFSPKANFAITVYSAKIKNVINLDRAVVLFFVSAAILFIAFLIFYLTDRNFHIQALVHSRTKELEVETERSKQATLAKSRFLANISHEIRTPLNIVLGMTDLLEATNLTQVQKHYMQSIRTSGRHLLSLLNDILDMTRIDLKEVIFKPSHVDSLGLISEACLAINEVAATKNLNFYVKIAADVPETLFIDHARLKQILINLLMNAVKYTEKGHVELDVGVIENEDVRSLSIKVSDTGIGISSENLDNIFKSFFQVDQKGANLSKGVGLGLSIVTSIVKRLNGDIQVQSKLREGSQFHVTIPLRDIQSNSWSKLYAKRAEKFKSQILFLSGDTKIIDVMRTYDHALQLDIKFKDRISDLQDLGSYTFAFVDVDFVNSEILSRLNKDALKKIFIFDFDLLKRKEDILLSDKTETIPHRLFLPNKTIEILENESYTSKDVFKRESKEIDFEGGHPLTVLIVEDDASNRILFQAYLANKKNWQIDYAHNGLSALHDYLENKKYDVMVTDLQMPEMDGFTLLSKLQDSQKPDRIIVLSADSTEETAHRAKLYKVDQFITKPVRKKEFLSAIEGPAH
jgi:signal transduction histidine kinase/CheY-like chemotaxis protein